LQDYGTQIADQSQNHRQCRRRLQARIKRLLGGLFIIISLQHMGTCPNDNLRPNIVSMVKTIVSIRHAKLEDASEIALAHDASWREAYRGVIPGIELERMIARRGPEWWHAAILRGSGLLVLEIDELIVGYSTFGRNRVPTMPYSGEIFELYLMPQYQGLGFGRRLFNVSRRELAAYGYLSTIVWALADNSKALSFYGRLGGQTVRQAEERFGDNMLSRVAFGFISAPAL
jgi:ribosomal protein S18 acetylase RimI-like enzyme